MISRIQPTCFQPVKPQQRFAASTVEERVRQQRLVGSNSWDCFFQGRNAGGIQIIYNQDGPTEYSQTITHLPRGMTKQSSDLDRSLTDLQMMQAALNSALLASMTAGKKSGELGYKRAIYIEAFESEEKAIVQQLGFLPEAGAKYKMPAEVVAQKAQTLWDKLLPAEQAVLKSNLSSDPAFADTLKQISFRLDP